MWYRRITEYNDIDPAPPVSQRPIHKPREEIVVFGQTSFSKVIFGPQLPEHLSASKKRKRDEVPNNDITLFKRVRVLSKKTRVRRIKQISGPFTRLATARNGFTETSIGTTRETTRLTNGPITPNQSLSTFPKKENFIRSTANSIPNAFLNITPVPRTGDTADQDDSDDDLNGSDRGGDDGEDEGDEKDSPGLPLPMADSPLPHQDESGILDLQEGNSFEEPRTRTTSRSSDAVLKDFYEEVFPPLKERQLHEAITRDVSDEVLQLLDSGANAECEWEMTPLCRAIEIGNEIVIETLLVRGANINQGDVAGWTALMRAAEKGVTWIVTLLLLHGANVEAENVYRDTALLLAAGKGHVAVVQMLLDRGAAFSTDAVPGRTELQRAVANGYDEVVRLLLEYGADRTVKDVHGLTLLHKAALKNHHTLFQLLVQDGADPEVVDNYGLSAQALLKDNIPTNTTEISSSSDQFTNGTP